MKSKNSDIINQDAAFGWVAIGTAGVLLIPLIAMQFSNEVVWSPFDFAVMGLLLFSMGSLFVLLARRTKINRLILAALVGILTLWIWAELAVGVFTNIGS